MKALGHDSESHHGGEGLSQMMNGHKMNIHSKKTLYDLAQSKVLQKNGPLNVGNSILADIGVGTSSMEQELDANISSLTIQDNVPPQLLGYGDQYYYNPHSQRYFKKTVIKRDGTSKLTPFKGFKMPD